MKIHNYFQNKAPHIIYKLINNNTITKINGENKMIKNKIKKTIGVYFKVKTNKVKPFNSSSSSRIYGNKKIISKMKIKYNNNKII